MYPHRIVTFSKFMLERNDSPGWQQVDTAPKPQPQKPNLTPEQQKVFESVESIQKAIEEWKAGEKIVWGRANIIWAGLEKIKAGLVPDTSVNDPEYKELLSTYNRLVKEYQDITKKQSQTSQVLDYYVSQLEWEAKTYIEKKSTPQSSQEKSPEEKFREVLKKKSDEVAEKYKFNKETFYSKVKEIKVDPNLSEDDNGSENIFRTEAEALAEVERIGKDSENDASMKESLVNQEELNQIDQKRKEIAALPEYQRVQSLEADVGFLTRKVDILSRDLDTFSKRDDKGNLLPLSPEEEEKKKKAESDLGTAKKELEAKQKELDGTKTEPYKKLEGEIDKLSQEWKKRIDKAIRSNPAGFRDRIREGTQWKNQNILIQIINALSKQIFWIDLFPSSWWVEWSGSYAWVEWGAGLIWWEWATELGSLSEQFESGGKGPYEITPNDAGLWFPSYGTYQFNRDTLQQFADYMKIDGDCRQVWSDTPFAQAWKKKIGEIWVQKFKEEERAFAKKVYFEPQLARIKSAWIDTSKFSLTMQNVVWSTAIQHGQNTDLIATVLKKYSWQPWNIETERKAIEEIYAERQKRYGAGAKRYSQEKAIALAQLSAYNTSPDGSARSLPMEFSSSWTTLCSQTARLNAARFWVSVPSGNAKDVERSYGSKLDTSWNPPSWNYADIFSGSTRYPQYGHRAFAYKNAQWNWYVLDPYLRIQSDRQAPIPWGTYMNFLRTSRRWFNGAVSVG